MKPNTVFKRAYNRGLARLPNYPIATDIGSEPSWSQALAVSRTTVRAIFSAFAATGLISYDGRRKALLAPSRPRRLLSRRWRPSRSARSSKSNSCNGSCMGTAGPGQQINALELSRQFGVSASAIRDYLNRFPRYGLLERRPSGSWVFKGFTEDFAEELCEVRSDVRAAFGSSLHFARPRRARMGRAFAHQETTISPC